jgi:hypothetical protein
MTITWKREQSRLPKRRILVCQMYLRQWTAPKSIIALPHHLTETMKFFMAPWLKSMQLSFQYFIFVKWKISTQPRNVLPRWKTRWWIDATWHQWRSVHANHISPPNTSKIKMPLPWFSGTPQIGRRSGQIMHRLPPPTCPSQALFDSSFGLALAVCECRRN